MMSTTVLSRARPANCQGAHSHRSLNILLAESQHNVLYALSLALRTDGHTVTGATDGSELLEEVARLIIDGDRNQFDVIISAQDLPGMPGISVLAGLRACGRQTPFVLMTDNTAVQVHARALDAFILPSPLSVESLRDVVHQAEHTTHEAAQSFG